LRHKCRGRYGLIALAAAFSCAIGAPTPVLAQQGATAATENWRPKDGPYGLDPGTDPNASCETLTLHRVELGKRLIVSEEMYKCEIMKITETAPATLRLNAKCDDVHSGKSRDTIVIRRIDDQSFSMGWRGQRSYRYVYCPEITTEEAKRRELQKQLERAEWHPRDGVYAKPGADFNDRCSKSGDAVIELGQISISTDASLCEVASIESGTQASIKIDARCDLKPGQTGTVARSIRGEIVFAPVGSEKIIITDSGNQTISIQKSRNGEFSELAQPLAYCPEAAQRAYADSKKAK
jgi:hypothetical protein